MEPCCALKYYPAVDACQSEKVPSITLLIKIDKAKKILLVYLKLEHGGICFLSVVLVDNDD